ncbi:MAG: amino acid adenylation domain-containing protein, partial [Chloroflexi bacterium]|nr:amino acid adenylation domain-containing protein [Chloroflexota bacterium]
MSSKAANPLAGLSPAEQRELLNRLLKEKAQKENAKVEQAPLSFAQERLWFLYQLDPESAAYNLRTAVHLSGNLDIPALTQSLQDVVQRHDALRTRFAVVQGQPMQLITPTLSIPLPIVDVDKADVERFAEVEVQRPFCLNTGPLIRAKLLRLSLTDHVLLITMHHIISDGWSIGLLIRELTQLYEAKVGYSQRGLPQIPVQYAEYAEWQRQWLQGDVLEKQLHYWREKLADCQTVLDLPTDYPRPPRQTDAGTRIPFQADAATATALHTLCQTEGVTMFMLLMAAFNTLLYRYTHQTDLLIGTPVAGRQRRQLEGVIGLFVNTLVLRTDISGNPTFRDLLKQVSQTAKEAYDHQDIPFERLVETLQPVRDPSRSPLFQVMLVLQNAPMDALQLADLQLTQLRPNKGTSQFDMTLMMWDDDKAVRGYLEYRTDLFSTETMTQFLVHFGELLTSIVANPDAPIAQLALLTEAEHQKVVQTWNDTAVSHANHLCVHQYISQQAAKTPNHIALDFAGRQLTYQELDTRANQLAHCLIEAGIQPDTMVALCVERSIEMIVGILGVMKAGGAYVPIDATYPAQRIDYIIEDTQAKLLLSQSHLLSLLPPHQANVICLDTVDTAVYPTYDPETAVSPDNLAYVIYTSGSTGRPKGVLVPHRGLLNVIKADQLTYQLTPEDRVLQFASLSFDASVYDILMALSVGATLQLATQAQILPGPDLLQLLQEKEITIATLMPSVVAALPDAPLPALHTITVAGEPCSTALVNRWSRNRRFFNLYGPTEASIWSSAALCRPGQLQAPPIGKPISNTQLYALDPFLQPVPVGVVGELHIGGAGITRGYHNRPGLTATRFIPDPFGATPGARLYKTGDLVRFRANGELEFIGRADHQVKIRGYRIELGEIAHALAKHDAVKEATAIVREDKPQQKRIVAYVIPKKTVTAVTLRNHLKESLPDYMIPAAFVMLNAFPQTHSHKLNVAALPAPETTEQQHDYVAPRNETETELAQLWQALLGKPKISTHDSFFDIGGHSLLVTQLASRIRTQFEVEFPLRDLFDVTTIATQAERIAQMCGQDGGRQMPTIHPQP